MELSGDAGGVEDGQWPAEGPVATSQLDKPDSPGSSKFLFVHMTGASAAYKHGNRPAIRSHVRTTAHAGRDTREARQMTRLEKRRIRPTNPPLGPQLHESHCPANLTVALSPRSSLPFLNPGDDILALGTKELHAGQQALPGVTTVLNPSPFALVGDSLIDDIRSVSGQRKVSVTYCKTCGRLLGGGSPLMQAFQRIDAAKRHLSRKSTNPSPVEILGAGRVDPFASYPMQPNDKVNELLDHRKWFCSKLINTIS
jgi:hypothetical protein